MGRSTKDLRQALAPVTGQSLSSDQALLRAAVPQQEPTPIAEKVQEVAKDLRAGYPKRTS
jgi:hypothetical protein